MISVGLAKQLIDEHIKHGHIELRTLNDSVGYISASSVYSPISSPPFAQSAMDGYAFCYKDSISNNEFIVQGIIQAGDTQTHVLEQGKCFRIFTGAPVPLHADTVIIQEHCIAKEQTVLFDNSKIMEGANIRTKGSQVQKGEEFLKKGVQLTPGIIGYLATLGIEQVEVFAKPKVTLLITGNELVQAGIELKHGQIYESNSVMLQAALKEGGIEVCKILFAKDTLENTAQTIDKAFFNTDFLLITGGISVGDYDFVQQALDIHQVTKVFYKLKQKPGKPLYFGKKENTYVFALPGNPSSVLTCFYEYIIPAIKKFCGSNPSKDMKKMKPLLHDYAKKGDLTHYLKGLTTIEGVTILGAQESYKLNSFTEANCLVIIEEEKNEIKKGELVEVHLLKELWYK